MNIDIFLRTNIDIFLRTNIDYTIYIIITNIL